MGVPRGRAELGVLPERLQGVVTLVAVGQQLWLAPGSPGVTQDVDDVLARLRGELERQGPYGRTSASIGLPLCMALMALSMMSFISSGV